MPNAQQSQIPTIRASKASGSCRQTYHNPVCEKCMVSHFLQLQIDEYSEFISNLEANGLKALPDHARGFCHGQLALAREVVKELGLLLANLKLEMELRSLSSKGL